MKISIFLILVFAHVTLLSSGAFAYGYKCSSYQLNYYGHVYSWPGDTATLNIATGGRSLYEINKSPYGSSAFYAYSPYAGSTVFNWNYYGDPGTDTLSAGMLSGASSGNLVLYDSRAVLYEYYTCIRNL